jgi:hypothetical protein
MYYTSRDLNTRVRKNNEYGSRGARFSVASRDFLVRNEENNNRQDRLSPRQDPNPELNRIRDRSANHYT